MKKFRQRLLTNQPLRTRLLGDGRIFLIVFLETSRKAIIDPFNLKR